MLQSALILITLTSMLSACGGGGGGSSSPPPPAPPPANVAPEASFTVTPASGAIPLRVTTDASASTDSDGSITSYAWNFGNGQSGLGQVATQTYTTAGSFTVTLTVTDDDGATASTTRTVTSNTATSTFSLSGTIQILSSSAIDSDTNDRFTTVVANNNFAQAQNITNPVALGGFANLANTGSSGGNLFAVGDPGDFYRISLTGNERVLLTVGDSAADLDLRLWDANQNLINTSQGTTQTESIDITAPGTYFIEVFPFSGESNYVLNVGRDLTANALPGPSRRMNDEFVPGEIILQTRNATFSAANMRPLSIVGPAAQTEVPRLYKLDSSTASVQSFVNTPGGLPEDGVVSAGQRLKIATLNEVKKLSQRSDVESAEPNGIRHALRTPNDQLYRLQWHYNNINLPLAWDVSVGSTEVIVAVVDTGVLLSHPDLDAQLVSGYDFISSASRARDGNGIDSNPNDEGDRANGGSSSFHGTHVAGTVAAESDNGIGVAGVAWNARIMPMRALGADGGTTFDVLQAIRFAAGLSNDSGTVPPRRADIINLSLGSTFSSQTEQDTINQARAAGVIIIAAAGNESTTVPSYPAAYSGVVSVSATTITNSLAGYSNRGSTIDVAAPGGNGTTDINGDGFGDGVVSTMGNDGNAGPVEFGWDILNGTSMAAPHVAGVAALMKAVHRNLTPAQFDAALLAGELTDDLGTAGRDDSFGHGLINAQKALARATSLAAGQGVNPGPVLSATLSTLNFGSTSTSLPLTLQNIGTGNIQINSITPSQPWLTVGNSGVPASGIGTYAIAVNRSGLADGTYTATLAIISDTNDININVIMQVSSVSISANAGLHFVILVSTTSGTSTLPAVITRAVNGEYRFTMNNVPSGQYRMFAGTDSNNDDFLCDPGEACGAYATLDSPDILQVNANRSGLVFATGFRTNLGSFAAGSNNQGEVPDSGYPIQKPDAANKEIQR